MLFLQIFPDSSYSDEWTDDRTSRLLMYSDSFSAKSNVAMGTKQRRRSSTGDVELVQKDITKALNNLTDDNTVVIKEKLLLPVKMESLGTPSSIDSTEESSLHPITMVTQQAAMTDDIINLDTTVANDNTTVANDNTKSSEC